MKRKRPAHLLALAVVALLCTSAISTDQLRTDVFWLADSAREGRRAGTEEAAEAAGYIETRLHRMGFEVQIQEFGSNRRNVIGRVGTAEKYVLIGSHYDGQGAGFPSASDNAAGVAVLMEVARELQSRRLPASLVVVAFDNEEEGLRGSRHYADNPPAPLENAAAAIIFDTMGRSFIDLQTFPLFVFGTEYSAELADVIQNRAGPEVMAIGTDLIGPRSDFAPFARKRVPYLFFTNATHRDYHGPGDTADRINYGRLAEQASLIAGIVEDIARVNTPPAFFTEPVYPPQEVAVLLRYMATAEEEHPALPEAYRLVFADLGIRAQSDVSRELLRVATSALLGLATPRLSPAMLSFIVGPFYENAGSREIAAAVYEEASRWIPNASTRHELEEKVNSLRN